MCIKIFSLLCCLHLENSTREVVIFVYDLEIILYFVYDLEIILYVFSTHKNDDLLEVIKILGIPCLRQFAACHSHYQT